MCYECVELSPKAIPARISHHWLTKLRNNAECQIQKYTCTVKRRLSKPYLSENSLFQQIFQSSEQILIDIHISDNLLSKQHSRAVWINEGWLYWFVGITLDLIASQLLNGYGR